MDLAGTPSWFHWKKQAIENGKLVVPGEELEGIKRVKTVPKAKSPGRPSLKVKPIMDAKEGIETLGEVIPARPKTGAAAVLP